MDMIERAPRRSRTTSLGAIQFKLTCQAVCGKEAIELGHFEGCNSSNNNNANSIDVNNDEEEKMPGDEATVTLVANMVEEAEAATRWGNAEDEATAALAKDNFGSGEDDSQEGLPEDD